MPQTSAERQRTYRQRTKQAQFYQKSYIYKRATRMALQTNNGSDILALIDECYKVGSGPLAERVCVLICEFLSTAIAMSGSPGR